MRKNLSGTSNRRDFLAAGLVSAGALALGRAALAADPPESGPYGPFKMGLQSYSLRNFKLDDALQKTSDLGLKHWESFPAHVPPDTSKAAEYKQKVADKGIRIDGFGVVRFGTDQDANRKLFEFGQAIGLGYFSCDPDPAAFDGLDKLVEEFGIPIGIHNHGPGHRYGPIASIRDAIKDHHEKIGCCIDTGHFLRSREDPVEAVEVFDKRIYGVHLKDVKDATHFTVLGEGDLRLADLLKALAKRHYSYCMALEYEENPKDPLDEIRACLATVRKAVPKG
jgi:sugar phosphate isomerase/epimerase